MQWSMFLLDGLLSLQSHTYNHKAEATQVTGQRVSVKPVAESQDQGWRSEAGETEPVFFLMCQEMPGF